MEHEHYKPEAEMLFNKGDLLFRLSQPYPHLLWLIIPLLCRVLWTYLMNRSQKAVPGSQTISFQQSPKRCASSRNILQFPGWTQHLRADDKIDPNIKLHCVAVVLSWSVHVIKPENGLEGTFQRPWSANNGLRKYRATVGITATGSCNYTANRWCKKPS